MSKREAHSRIIPRVFCEDAGGYSRPALCALCGKAITKSRLVWARLLNDPQGFRRPLHRGCAREFRASALPLPL
jgi:hypothetical protein